MVINRRQVGRIIIFSLSGETGRDEIKILVDKFEQEMRDGYNYFILNLSEAKASVAVHGLDRGIFTLLHMQAFRKGGRLYLAAMSADFARVMNFRIEKNSFRILPTELEAIRTCSKQVPNNRRYCRIYSLSN